MALTLVATPIGHPKDVTLRSLDLIERCDLIIGEEARELTTFLKKSGLPEKEFRLLNEHTTKAEVEELASYCADNAVVLVSDCGTPGFCDPGADLVAACRRRNVKVQSAPGASSLMTLLSLSGVRINSFVFEGFLPAENVARAKRIEELTHEKRALILMDTPYRMTKLMTEVAEKFPGRRGLLGTNLTQREEAVFDGPLAEIASKVTGQKAEFVLLIYPG